MKKFLTLVTILMLLVFIGNTVSAYDGGVFFGQETISKSTDISGGSYFYLSPIIRFNEDFFLNLRYTTDLAPNLLSDHLLSVSSQFNKAYFGNNSSGRVSMYWGLTFMTNFKSSYYGVDFCPFFMELATSDNTSTTVKLLPVGLLYNPKNADYLKKVEFISIGFYF